MMTTTVTVKTRALGATVQSGDDTFEMGPHQERRFDTDDTMNLSVTQAKQEEPAAGDLPLDPDNVPGRAENDALLSKEPVAGTDASPKAKPASKSTDNGND